MLCIGFAVIIYFYLGSTWNPTKEVYKLSVMFVNQDQGYNMSGMTTHTYAHQRRCS